MLFGRKKMLNLRTSVIATLCFFLEEIDDTDAGLESNKKYG